MLVTKAVLLAGLSAVVGAETVEIIEGYKFVKSGPAIKLPKIEYEMAAARTALDLLKTRLGPEGLINLLQPDIKEADTFWHNTIDSSTPDKWVPADGRGIAFLPNVTAARFALWSQSPLADAVNNAANPEHYVKQTKEVAPGVLESEILEGWGGVTTYFTIPNYGPPDLVKWPMLRPLPEYPFQAAGDKVLLDGTEAVFGVLHISMRDVDGAPYGETLKGTEVWATIWYGDALSEEFIEQERQHMVIEIINLTLQCQRDIESGAFVPPV
jgi:hypothetical protein